MKRVLFTLLFLLLTFSFLSAQLTASGKVIDETGAPLAGVNVLLYHPEDTLQLIYGATTAEEGRWEITNIAPHTYRFVFSMVGFSRQDTVVTVREKDVRMETILSPSAQLLEELIVTGNLLTVLGNKEVRLFNKEEIDRASSGLELLGNLPNLYINNLHNKLQTVNGGTVLILINGVKSEEEDLMGMPPEYIHKAEYYSDPPARYRNSGVGAVLAVTTRRPKERGGYVMANLSNSFTTGEGTNLLQGKLSQDKNDYTLRYFNNYCVLNKNLLDQHYSSELESGKYQVDKEGLNGKYTGVFHRIQATWTNIIPDKQIWNITAKLAVSPLKEETPQLITRSDANTPVKQERSDVYAKTEMISPVVDIYYSRNFNHKQRFIINTVNTWYDNSTTRDLTLSSGGTDHYEALTHIKSKSYSVISEANYTKGWNRSDELSLGVKHSYKNLDEKYNSNLQAGSTTHTHLNNFYMYAEWNGKYKKLYYKLGAGAEKSWFTREISKSYFVLKPVLSLSYLFSRTSSLKLYSEVNSRVPDISLLTGSPAYIDSAFISRGNPELTPYYTYVNNLTYTLNLPVLYLQTGPSYRYSHHPYTTLFFTHTDYLEKTTGHINYTQAFNYGLFFRWVPVKWLQLAPYYAVEYQTSKGDNFHYHHWHHSFTMRITASYRKITLSTTAVVQNRSLTGVLTEDNNGYYEAGVTWKNKNLSISAASLFYTRPNKIKTYENSSFSYSENKSWNNYKGLTYIKLVYNLPFGKNIKRSAQQRINNTDNDSGIYMDNRAKQ